MSCEPNVSPRAMWDGRMRERRRAALRDLGPGRRFVPLFVAIPPTDESSIEDGRPSLPDVERPNKPDEGLP